MRCSYCGSETGEKDICAVCGKKQKGPDSDVEVEYKEFKISEFLEIRKKQKTLEGARRSRKTTGRRADDRKGGREVIPGIERSEARFPAIIIVILSVIAALAWLFYFLRFR